MSKNTFFHTRFWQDSYISGLDPIEKLLFNYCLTSPFLSLSGIYEVPVKYIAVETGIENSMVTKILDRFKNDSKIVYENGWLCILNYPKYQSYNLPNVKRGLEKELASVPEEILNFFILQGYITTSIANALPMPCQALGTRVQEQGKGTWNMEVEKTKVEKEATVTHGEFQNVKLTETEYDKLIEQLNENAVLQLITELDQYIASSGKKYKSHYATIQAWARRRIEKHVVDTQKAKTKII